MTMILRARPHDPITILLDRAQRLYDELRAAAVKARQAAQVAETAANDQQEAATALSPPEEDDHDA